MKNELNNKKLKYFFTGFISISLSWILGGVLTYLFIQRNTWNSDIIIYLFFLQGKIAYIGFLPFQIFILNKIKSKSIILNPLVFPIITIIYAILVSIITGIITDELYDCIMQIFVTIITGLFFGIIYSVLIKFSEITMLFDSLKFRISTILIPIILLIIIFYIIPIIKPLWVYEFLPSETKNTIIINTLKKLKPGDKFSKIKENLPLEYKNEIYEYYGRLDYSLSSDLYTIVIENDTVKTLEFIKTTHK